MGKQATNPQMLHKRSLLNNKRRKEVSIIPLLQLLNIQDAAGNDILAVIMGVESGETIANQAMMLAQRNGWRPMRTGRWLMHEADGDKRAKSVDLLAFATPEAAASGRILLGITSTAVNYLTTEASLADFKRFLRPAYELNKLANKDDPGIVIFDSDGRVG